MLLQQVAKLQHFGLHCVLLTDMLLQQVAKLQLKRGHQPSAICTARLPCLSVAALHSLPGPAAAEKEFLLVATYTDDDLVEGGSGQVRQAGQQGFLSVFEVCLAQQSKHMSSRYDMSWLSCNSDVSVPCMSLQPECRV